MLMMRSSPSLIISSNRPSTGWSSQGEQRSTWLSLGAPKEDLKRIRLLCAGSWQRSSMALSRALQCACSMLSSAEPLKRAAPNKVSDSKSTHWNSENEGYLEAITEGE